MAKRGILGGPKMNNRHSTFLPLAGKVISLLKPLIEVRKVVLGPIKPAPGGPRRVTIRDDKGQWKVQVRDNTAVQILWVIGGTYDLLQATLKDVER